MGIKREGLLKRRQKGEEDYNGLKKVIDVKERKEERRENIERGKSQKNTNLEVYDI